MNVGMSDEFTNFEQKAIVKVCGIGGGGGNAVGRMIGAGMKDVEFITINTDAQALRHSPAGTRLQIGGAGLGAGARPEVARQAAIDDRERISEALRGADMIFLTAGLGGGTGTGATPIVAEIAQETGALTVAVVTLPFGFEGGERMENAMRGLDALQDYVDAAVVVPNDRLSILCQTNISFVNAFRLADEVLHDGVRAISELITIPGLINLDFADVRTILKESGRALMGIGSAEGENRAVRAAEEAIVCPLLENATIDGATRVIVNVQGGIDIGMREVHDAVSTVQKAAHPQANIIFGAVVDDSERADLKITVIAAGFAEKRIVSVRPFTEIPAEAQLAAVAAGAAKLAELAPELTNAAPVVEDELAAGKAEDELVLEAPVFAPAPEMEEGSALSFAPDQDDDEELDWMNPSEPPIQTLFPDDEPEIEPFPGLAKKGAEEDLSIPAFMRRRMNK